MYIAQNPVSATRVRGRVGVRPRPGLPSQNLCHRRLTRSGYPLAHEPRRWWKAQIIPRQCAFCSVEIPPTDTVRALNSARSSFRVRDGQKEEPCSQPCTRSNLARTSVYSGADRLGALLTHPSCRAEVAPDGVV